MRRFIGALMLSGVLLAPIAVRADDHDKDHRYYDSYKRDYHEWNEQEARAYRHWLQENHRHEHEWVKANKREQREYWQWRHEHPDWHE